MTEQSDDDRETHVLGVAEAKRRFSELIDRVGDGEQFIVARHGRPAVALVAPSERSMRAGDRRPIGLAAVAGALADWEEIDEVVRDLYASRRRSHDRPVPSLD
jgi:prevent-host-death family protein